MNNEKQCPCTIAWWKIYITSMTHHHQWQPQTAEWACLRVVWEINWWRLICLVNIYFVNKAINFVQSVWKKNPICLTLPGVTREFGTFGKHSGSIVIQKSFVVVFHASVNPWWKKYKVRAPSTHIQRSCHRVGCRSHREEAVWRACPRSYLIITCMHVRLVFLECCETGNPSVLSIQWWCELRVLCCVSLAVKSGTIYLRLALNCSCTVIFIVLLIDAFMSYVALSVLVGETCCATNFFCQQLSVHNINEVDGVQPWPISQ